MNPVIIIGSGIAGYTLASEYRKLNSNQTILLITSDTGHQYSKPMLSNAIALGKSADQLASSSPEKMAERLNIEVLRDTEVTSIDTELKCIETRTTSYKYSSLILAMGADTVKPRLKGTAVQDVFSVNDLVDYYRFRSMLKAGQRVLIIGGGLIGCEFANDLLHAEATPVVVDPNPYPLSSLVTPSVARGLQAALEAAGTEWHLETHVTQVDKSSLGYVATLSNGELVEADVVLSAIGLRPRTALASSAGITTRKGICVDEYGQTDAADVYALGDCAEYGDGRVMLYIRPALVAARAIAATLDGKPTRIELPLMPVSVKTPLHPIVVQRPCPTINGHWSTSIEGDGHQCLFIDADELLHGFIVSGSASKTHSVLSKKLGTQI